jgi:hypothetical protein
MPKAPKIPGRKKANTKSGPALGPVLMYGAGGLAAVFVLMELWSWKTASDVMGYEHRCDACLATAGAILSSDRNAWYAAVDAGIAAGKSRTQAAQSANTNMDPIATVDAACYSTVVEQFYNPSSSIRTGEGNMLGEPQDFMGTPFVVGSAHATPDAAFTAAAVKACSYWTQSDEEVRSEGSTMREAAIDELRYQRNPGDKEKEMVNSLCYKTNMCTAEEKADRVGYLADLASFKAKSDKWAAGLASKWDEKKKEKKEAAAAAAAAAKEDAAPKDNAANKPADDAGDDNDSPSGSASEGE